MASCAVGREIWRTPARFIEILTMTTDATNAASMVAWIIAAVVFIGYPIPACGSVAFITLFCSQGVVCWFIVTAIARPFDFTVIKTHDRPIVRVMAIAAYVTGRGMPSRLFMAGNTTRRCAAMVKPHRRPAADVMAVLAKVVGGRMIIWLAACRGTVMAPGTVVSHIIVIKIG